MCREDATTYKISRKETLSCELWVNPYNHRRTERKNLRLSCMSTRGTFF